MSTSGITYELALALKNAGFPQKGYWFWSSDETDIPRITTEANVYDTCSIMKSADGRSYEKLKLCSAPTLSELIEACGKKINILKLWCNLAKSKHKYGVQLEGESLDDMISYSTPETAVANLWLKLNGK